MGGKQESNENDEGWSPISELQPRWDHHTHSERYEPGTYILIYAEFSVWGPGARMPN